MLASAANRVPHKPLRKPLKNADELCGRVTSAENGFRAASIRQAVAPCRHRRMRPAQRARVDAPRQCRRADLRAIWFAGIANGSVCACEQVTGASAIYAGSQERDHGCKPSPHRYTPASASGEKAGQAARANRGSPGNRAGGAGSKSAANVFTIPHGRETAPRGRLIQAAQIPVEGYRPGVQRSSVFAVRCPPPVGAARPR